MQAIQTQRLTCNSIYSEIELNWIKPKPKFPNIYVTTSAESNTHSTEDKLHRPSLSKSKDTSI